MENEETYQQKALRLVYQYVESKFEKTDPRPSFEVYVVWFSKTLQNWKALISTTLPDGMYYEVTYDGNKRQAYLDAYKKFDNVTIPDEGVQPREVPAFEGFDNQVLGRIVESTEGRTGLKYLVNIDNDTARRGIQIGEGNIQSNIYRS